MSDNNTTQPLNEREKRLVRQLLLANLLARKHHNALSLDSIAIAAQLSKGRISQILETLEKEMAEEGGSK